MSMNMVEGEWYEVTTEHKFEGRLLRTELRGDVKVAVFATDRSPEHHQGGGLRIIPVDKLRVEPLSLK